MKKTSRKDAKLAKGAKEERDQGLGTREEEEDAQLSSYAPPLKTPLILG